MSSARLTVQFAGPLVTIQDGGRVGHMRYGVPASGPMDRVAFAAANAALGNPHYQTGIEISMGGLVLECKEGAVSVAVAGGDFTIEHAGSKSAGWQILTLRQGERLAIRGGKSGSWASLSFAGEVQTQDWLGHSATLSTSGFGGGALHTGQELLVQQPAVREDREGEIERPGFVEHDAPFRVVLGPQDHWFQEEAIEALLTTRFSVTDNYDRMGMRLDGPKLPLKEALSIPSEPIIRGSVQVSGEGAPTVLLADHQTTGGYPKIATVISPDTDRLTQLRSRDSLSFKAISARDAISETRAHSAKMTDYLHRISVPRGTMLQRLLEQNLISGVIAE